MANVTVQNLKSKTIHCKEQREKLLDILLSETDWMHACGGKGRCTTCKAIIVSGEENLSAMTVAEQKFAALSRLKPNERLSCQVEVLGDIEIQVPKESQLPHLQYSN